MTSGGWRTRFFAGDHLQPVATVAVFDFVHNVVNQQHAATARLEKICRVARIGYLADIEPVPLILDCEDCLARAQFGCYPQEFFRIMTVPMLDSIHKRLVEGDVKIRLLELNQPQLRYSVEQVFEYRLHQREVARQFEIDLFADSVEVLIPIYGAQLERQGSLDNIVDHRNGAASRATGDGQLE